MGHVAAGYAVTAIRAGRTSSHADGGNSCPRPSMTSSARAGDLARERLAVREREERVVRAVDDERRAREISRSRAYGMSVPSRMKWLFALGRLEERS